MCVFVCVSESCSSVLRGLCVLPFLFFPTERASTSGNPYRHICLCTLTFCLSWWNQEKGFDITNGLMAGGKKYLWKVDLNTAYLKLLFTELVIAGLSSPEASWLKETLYIVIFILPVAVFTWKEMFEVAEIKRLFYWQVMLVMASTAWRFHSQK